MVYGDLGRAWREAGFVREARVSARSLKRFLEKNADRHIAWASAGDAMYEAPRSPGDRRVIGLRTIFAVYGSPAPDSDTAWAGPSMQHLSKFLEGPCLIVHGVPIPRRTVITYVANKLGSAHYADERGDLGRLLDGLEEMMLSQEQGKMRAVYFEVLAIGQALVFSEDVRALCDSTG